MDWFLPLRQPYLHYDNDDIAIWNFTVAPDEIKRVVTQLVELQKQWTFPEINFPYLSVMLVLRNSRLGQASWEAILNRDDAEVLTRAIREVLDVKNGLGRDIIDLQRQLIFT
jgi:hypothetical protein